MIEFPEVSTAFSDVIFAVPGKVNFGIVNCISHIPSNAVKGRGKVPNELIVDPLGNSILAETVLTPLKLSVNLAVTVIIFELADTSTGIGAMAKETKAGATLSDRFVFITVNVGVPNAGKLADE